MDVTANPAAVAESFRDIFLSEETGRLEVRSGGRTCSILFDRGLVAGAELVPGPTPGAAAGNRSAEIITLAFGSDPGQVEFVASPALDAEPATDLLQTVNLFLLGMRTMSGFEEIREVLMALESRIVLRPNPSVPIDRLDLHPVHGFVLSRLGSGLTFGDVVATAGPDEEEQAARFLFGLMLLGSVAFDPPVGHGPLRTEVLLAEHKRDFAREEAESAFIRDTYARIIGQNPYEILAVNEDATTEEVRQAYDDRRRSLAPERFMMRVRESLRTELATIEARLTEIFLTLQSRAPLRRMQPEQESLDLNSAVLRRELTKTEVAATAEEGAQQAEGYYQKAKKFFSDRDYFNCIQFCTQAIRQNDQVARYFVLLGESQGKNPERRWQKMAEQSFLQACKLDPWNADFLVVLGQFYRRHGLSARARRQFERALEIQPGHEKAKEELHTLV